MKIIECAFFILLGLTVSSLVFGLFIYFKGGASYRQHANAAMRFRVLFQGLTLILFFILLGLGK